MALGTRVRGMLGPLERPIADLYRRYFVDLRTLAAQIREAAEASNILEVGCGEGSLVEQLKRHFPGSAITGIDITPRIGRLYHGDRANVTFRQATIDRIAKESPAAFDLVILADVLHHVPVRTRVDLLAGIRDALREGGTLVLKDWKRAANLAHLLCWISDRWISGERVQFFGPGELPALIERVFGPGSIEAESFTPPHRNNALFVVRKRRATPARPP
jgi:SAM-dependent methyltransferase